MCSGAILYTYKRTHVLRYAHNGTALGRLHMRKLMVKLVAACFTVLLFVTIFMGRTMFTSMAKEESAATPYYKSVRIQEGDSLWELANQYKDGSSMSTHEYVDQLRQMNSLKKDTIHAGQYLTVVYYK